LTRSSHVEVNSELGRMTAMLRRFALVVIATLGLATAIGALTAGPAAAAVGCDFSTSGLYAKYQIGVSHPTVQIGGNCTYSENWAIAVTIHHAYGDQAYVSGSSMRFQGCNGDWYGNTGDGSDCTDMDTYDTYNEIYVSPLVVTEPGLMMTWRAGSYAEDCCDYFYSDRLVRRYFPAKYATHSALSATRDGATVTVTVRPSHYSNYYRGFTGSPSTPVVIERYSNGAWSDYRTVTSPASGSAATTISFTQSGRYTYRARTPQTPTRWYSYSGAHTA
jgi:hypothetical protein